MKDMKDLKQVKDMKETNEKNKNHYAENMLKGRMAETLVDEMLKRSGNMVYRFGFEAVLENLTQIESKFDRNTKVAERLRAIPDLVVLDAKGELALVEVKFRWDPDALLYDNTIELLDRVEKYWNADIVFVNCFEKPYFRICRPPYFKNFSQPKKGLDFKPLMSVSDWNIPQEVYDEYESLVEKYLTPTMRKEEEK